MSITRPLSAAALALMLLISPQTTIGAQRDHVYNPTYQIKAYELTPAEEAMFSTADGVGSAFWNAWDVAGVNLSSVSLNGVDNYTWGDPADGVADGGVALRVAYGDQGIYLLYTATDDAWAGYVSPIDYANDACELFGCKLSASELYGPNMATNLPCVNGDGTASGFPTQLNSEYFNLQIRFGGLEPVETFSLNYWNPLMTDVGIYGCWPGSIVVYNRTVTFPQAVTTYGIKIDILPQMGQRRSQEWLVPWASWGGPNGSALTRRHANDKVALYFGYNDLDPGLQTQPTSMTWRNANPYSNTLDEITAGTTTVRTSYDAWGDIVFSDALDAVSPPSGWGGATPQGHAPVIGTRPIEAAIEDQPYTYKVGYTDEDPGDVVSLRLVTAPATMSIQGNAVLWTPVNSDVGTHVVVIRAVDTYGNLTDQIYNLTVRNTNDAPVITSTPLTSATVNLAYRYQALAQDPDVGDAVRFEALSIPAGMLLTQTGLITWTPLSSQVGAQTVAIRAIDIAGASDSQYFSITVTDTRHSPQITASLPDTLVADSLYVFPLSATVSRGDVVTWSLGSAPAGMALTDSFLVWRPTPAQVGQYIVVVYASCGVLRDTLFETVNVKIRRVTGISAGSAALSVPDRLTASHNPAGAGLTVGVPAGANATALVEAFDPVGRLVVRDLLRGAGYHQVSLDPAQAGAGMLIVKITLGSETLCQRIMLR